MAQLPFQPMSVGDVLDGAFSLYRRHFLTLIAIVALLYGPVVIAAGVLMAPMAPQFPVDPESAEMLAYSGEIALLGVVGFAALTVALGAVMRAVSDLFLTGEASIKVASGAALRRVISLVLGAVLQIVALMGAMFVGTIAAAILVAVGQAVAGTAGAVVLGLLGGLLTVVFVLYVFARIFAVAPVIVLERVGPVRAIRRSSRLARGRWKPIAVVSLVAVVLSVYLLPLGALFLVRLFIANPIVLQMLQTAITIVFIPYSAVCLTLLYYDTRIRSEGFDLEMLAKQVQLGGAAG